MDQAVSAASPPRACAALLPAVLAAALLASLLASIGVAQTPSTPPGSTISSSAPAAAAARARVEARSSDLLAVGTVQGNRLILRLSRVEDNAPVHYSAIIRSPMYSPLVRPYFTVSRNGFVLFNDR